MTLFAVSQKQHGGGKRMVVSGGGACLQCQSGNTDTESIQRNLDPGN